GAHVHAAPRMGGCAAGPRGEGGDRGAPGRGRAAAPAMSGGDVVLARAGAQEHGGRRPDGDFGEGGREAPRRGAAAAGDRGVAAAGDRRRQMTHDRDTTLIVDYLAGALSPAEAGAVQVRLREDLAFRAKAIPVALIWRLPGD